MKNKRMTGFSNLTKCGANAHSPSGSKHRRCGGKAKREQRLPRDQKGTWS